MWSHFVNLLSASWSGVLVALGTTTLSIVLFSLVVPIVAFIITMLVRWHAEGGFVDHLRKSAIPTTIGLIVPFVFISFVFLWSTVRTIYEDHQVLVSKAGSLRQQTKGLVDPKSRDDEIIELKKQIEVYKRAQPRPGSPEPAESSEIRIYPISHDLRPGIPKLEYVMTTGKMRSPVEIVATCDFPISGGSSYFLTLTGGSSQTTDHRRISAKQYRFSILDPVWSQSSPLWITVFFEGNVDRMPSCAFQVQ